MCLEEKKVTFTTKRNKGMSLELVTAGLKEKIGEDCGLGATLKFDFGDDGMLMLDATP